MEHAHFFLEAPEFREFQEPRRRLIWLEDAGEDGFLDFPGERHGHCQWNQEEKQKNGKPGVLQKNQSGDKEGWEAGHPLEDAVGERHDKHAHQQYMVDGAEEIGFVAEGFVWQHGGQSAQHQIEVKDQ